MKLLIVYATKTGCTRELAERIAQRLQGLGADCRLCAAADAPSPDDVDAVIVGSGVRAGNWHKAARLWVERHAKRLDGKPLALFTCGLMIRLGAGKAEEVRAYTDALLQATGLQPCDIGLLPGFFQPERFGFFERSVLKLMKTPPGDYRDFDAVDRWATELAPKLGLH